jgi:2-polyprenyl-3-methyl-5-hydroxy-6-metoxy-1,4-benzoquinol methylase
VNEPDGALLMNEAIRFLGHRESLKVLDFGCGAGNLVAALVRLGHDAYGCDIGGDWRGSEQ